MTIALPAGDKNDRPEIVPGTIARVVRYTRPQAGPIAALLALILAEGLLAIAPALLFQRIIDDGVLQGDAAAVTRLSLLAILATLTATGAQFAAQWLTTRIGQALVYRLRNDVFAHLQLLPIGFFTNNSTGALVSRLNNDVLGAQAAVAGVLPQLVSNVVGLGFVLATMAYLSWPVTVMALLLPPLVLFPAKRVGRRLRRVSHERLESVAELSSFVTERFNVSGMLLVQLYGARDRECDAFRRRNAVNRDLGTRMFLTGAVYTTALTAVSSVSVGLVYLIGGRLALAGTLSVGTLIALTALLARLYGPMNSLSTVRVEVMSSLASFERVFELLDEAPTILEKPGAPSLQPEAGDVEFDKVTFGYPLARRLGVPQDRATQGPPVVREITFKIQPGRTVALVGPSGAGKTTIAALLARLYDVDDGVVRIGGVDVRDVDLASLRRTVGVLTQDAHFFHDTIRANLLYAQPAATDGDITVACEAARLGPLVSSLPEKLDTIVGDRGYRLSGGEKQRLAIARLLLKAPTVVVLDEATAHLDVESETAVQRALATALVGRTTLVIAHRLSTVRNADEILVIDGGRVVERGTDEQLLKADGLYARLCRTQLLSDEQVRLPSDDADRLVAVESRD